MVKKYEIHYNVNIESNEQIIPPKFKFYEKLMVNNSNIIKDTNSHLTSQIIKRKEKKPLHMFLKMLSWLGTSTFLGVSLCKFSIQTCTQRNHYIMALKIWSWLGTSTFLAVSLCNFSIHTCTQWNSSPLEFFQVLKHCLYRIKYV